jgi:predicted transcriptional regulator
MNGGLDMKTVTIGVASRDEVNQRFMKAMGGESQGRFLSFATDELLWKVLTFQRWELLKTMCGAGSISVSEAARRAGREVAAVQSDIHALINAGLIDKTEDGDFLFPYDAIHVDFFLKAA